MKVCIPTINQFELLEEAIQLYQNDDAVESIHIIDNTHTTTRCQGVSRATDPRHALPVHVHG